MTEPTTGTILIVDDDEGVTTTFARMLRLRDGAQSLRCLSSQGFMKAGLSTPPLRPRNQTAVIGSCCISP